MKLAPEARLGGDRYRLERLLGAGGMASVWLARDERLERLVAVKVISDTLAADPGYLARFEREARAAAALSHPGVVKVFDYGVDDDRPYLVLEYVEGQTLADWVRHESPPSLDVDALARKLLDALAHIHDAGIVHRDIKPQNVLLAPDGAPKVTDFGIAKSGDASTLTLTGHVIGTANYIAPEVAAGAAATPASDLYSCGVLLRDAAAERPSPAVAALVTALTDPDPGQRPPSARAALELLDAREPTRPTARLPESHATAPTEVLHGPRRRVVTITPLAVVGVVAAVVLALVLLNADTEPPAEPLRPAASDAPLDQQLRTLERAVDHAAGQGR